MLIPGPLKIRQEQTSDRKKERKKCVRFSEKTSAIPFSFTP